MCIILLVKTILLYFFFQQIVSKYNVIDKKTDKHTGPVAAPDVQNWAQKYEKPDRQTYRKIDKNTNVQD